MGKLLKIDMERAFKSRKFILIVLVEVVYILVYSWRFLYTAITSTIPFLKQYIGIKCDYIPGAFHYWIGFYNSPFRMILFAVIPLLCAVAYGVEIFLDEKKHYNNQYFIRTDIRKYYLSKIITLFVNGGVVAAIPFILSLYINLMVLPMEAVNTINNYNFPLSDKLVCSGIMLNHPVIYCLIYILWIFVVYGIINCMTFIFSFILSNRFVVMIGSYFVYFASFVLGDFIKGIPLLWKSGRFNQLDKDSMYMIIIQYAVIVVAVAAMLFCVSRRKRDRL